MLYSTTLNFKIMRLALGLLFILLITNSTNIAAQMLDNKSKIITTKKITTQTFSAKSIAKIEAYNNGNGLLPPSLTLQDYLNAGVSGVDKHNLTVVNNSVLSAKSGEADSVEKIEKLVASTQKMIAINKIAAYQLSGVVNYSSHTDKISASPLLQDYIFAEVAGVTLANFLAVNAQVLLAKDHVNTKSKIQTLVAVAEAAISKIKNYNDSTATIALNIQDYSNIGLIGVHANNLKLLNTLLLATPSNEKNNTTKIQILVNQVNAQIALNKIKAYNNSDGKTAPSPELKDYFDVGIALHPINLPALNTLLLAAKGGIDSKAKIEALIKHNFAFISHLNINSGTATGNTTVLIYGDNFAKATGVSFGGIDALNFSLIDSKTIQITTPISARGIAGKQDVIVKNPNGSAILLDGWTYIKTGVYSEGKSTGYSGGGVSAGGNSSRAKSRSSRYSKSRARARARANKSRAAKKIKKIRDKIKTTNKTAKKKSAKKKPKSKNDNSNKNTSKTYLLASTNTNNNNNNDDSNDDIAPIVSISLTNPTLTISAKTTSINFTFSKSPKNFTIEDIIYPDDGKISTFTISSSLVYTAIFSANEDVHDNDNIISAGTNWTDSNDKYPIAISNSVNFLIDTKAPDFTDTTDTIVIAISANTDTDTIISQVNATDENGVIYAIFDPNDNNVVESIFSTNSITGKINFDSDEFNKYCIVNSSDNSADCAQPFKFSITATDNVGNESKQLMQITVK